MAATHDKEHDAPVLALNDVTAGAGTIVLHGLPLDVARGSVVVRLLGLNGGGKTILLLFLKGFHELCIARSLDILRKTRYLECQATDDRESEDKAEAYRPIPALPAYQSADGHKYKPREGSIPDKSILTSVSVF